MNIKSSYFTSFATYSSVVSFLKQYPNLLPVLNEVQYFIRLPTGHAGQPATEFRETKATKLV
jgi:hypothetical protein